jgi:predicted DNA-binding transcriptional regulator AlpA
MSQELLTVTQFKERYQISHTAFYRQVASKKLPIVKIGASTRVRLADAQAWLASLTGGAA